MITINGQRWQIQVVMHELSGGYEVIHCARLIRVQWIADSVIFAFRVGKAVANAAEESKQPA